MDKLLEHISDREVVAWKFLHTAHYFKHVSTQPTNDKFWIFVQNSLGESACLLWSHLFGKNKDKLHFGQFAARTDVKVLGAAFSKSEIKHRLIVRASFDEAGYNALWEQVMACRDKYIAHRDLDANPIWFPQLDLCVLIAEELRCVLADCVDAMRAHQPEDDNLNDPARFYRGQTN